MHNSIDSSLISFLSDYIRKYVTVIKLVYGMKFFWKCII